MGLFSFLDPIGNVASSAVKSAGNADDTFFNFLHPIAQGARDLTKSVAKGVIGPGVEGVRSITGSLTGNPDAAVAALERGKNDINTDVGFVQAVPRGFAQLYQTATGKPTATASNPFEKALYGSAPVESLPQTYRDVKKQTGSPAQAATSTALSFLGDAASLIPAAEGAHNLVSGFPETTKAIAASEVGSIGGDVHAPNPATDVHIPIGDSGYLRVSQDELNNLANAKSASDVKNIIGDALPSNVTDRIAPAIALTKDPNVVANILDRGTPSPTPLPPPEPTSLAQATVPTSVSTPIQTAGQGSGLDNLVYRQTIANGGFTTDLEGNQPSSGYAFAPNKDTEVSVPTAQFSPKVVADFIKNNAEELAKPGNHIGTWEDGDQTYLDVSRVGPASADTLAAAQDAHQLAAFDLDKFQDVPLGKMENGVYNKLDEAANIHNSYQEQNAGASSTASVPGTSEIPGGETKTAAAAGSEASAQNDTEPVTLSKRTQQAVDLATKSTNIGHVNVNPGGKIKELAANIRTAFSGEKNAQAQAGATLADTLKKLAPKEQDAITWYREAKGNMATLQEWLDKPNLEAYRGDIEDAMHLSPGAKEASAALDQVYEKAGANAKAQGTLKGVLNDYSNPRIYQQPDRQPGVVAGVLKQTTASGKQRVFENLPEAIDNGHLPATTNAADLAAVHLADFARVNTTNSLLDAMSEAKLGKYVAPDKIPDGFAQVGNISRTTAFKDAEGEAHAATRVFAAPAELAKGLRAITEPDFIRRVDGYRSIAAYQGLVKTVDLSYSFFHHITEAAQLFYQTKGGIDILRHGNKVLNTLDSPEFAQMENNFVKYGGITTKVSDVQDVMRNLIGTDKGVYGKITNAPVLKQILGGAEKSSSLLFDKGQRWIKVTDFQSKMQSWIEKHPEATPDEFHDAATGYAKEINSAYGGLNWEAMGVTKTAQSVMRGLLLAPDWVVSNLALSKYALTKGFTDTAGNAARAHLMTAFSTGLVATEVLNKSITGHFTNQNPKGHKWEVEIAPNVYVSIFRGGIGDILKLFSNIQDKGFAQGTAQFAQGKLSPIARTAVGLASGTQFTGQPITNKNDNFAQKTLDEAKFLATSALPVPFGVSSTSKYISDAVKSKEPVNPLVAATLATGISRFTKSSNGLSDREQASVENLAKNGASKQEQNANVQFYLTLKKTATDRTKADNAITTALQKNDVAGAQKAAQDYNQKLAASFKGWVKSYGGYSNAALTKAYNSNKIKLTTDSIKAREKSIQNNPLYSSSAL